jgi:hypothetical protein
LPNLERQPELARPTEQIGLVNSTPPDLHRLLSRFGNTARARGRRLMRYPITAIALQAGCVLASLSQVAANELGPVIPPELGIHSPAVRLAAPYYCEPFAYNFYHGTNYAEPPAVYRGYAYRYYYRYSAYRRVPLAYVCAP